MSSVKDHFFEVQQDNCISGFGSSTGSKSIQMETLTPGSSWHRNAPLMLDAGDEYEWLNRHTPSEFFRQFSQELGTASGLMMIATNRSHADTLNKLVYAHTVTLFRSFDQLGCASSDRERHAASDQPCRWLWKIE